MQDNLQVNMDEFLPLRDVVFNTLRRAILTGELKPGERLMEIHLANRLGVSRTPIREAIRKLELEGLVTMIPRRGAEVAQITEKSLQDVLEVRRALDALSVELACDRISEEALTALGSACEALRWRPKQRTPKKWRRRMWHCMILSCGRRTTVVWCPLSTIFLSRCTVIGLSI